MKKNKLNLTLLLLVFASIIFAQDRPTFPKVEDMHNLKWQFLASKAQLTKSEADAVQPVFMDYEKGLWDFHFKNGEFFKNSMKKINDQTVNYDEVNDKIAQIKITEAFMFRNYHQKLKKLLSPEKLFKYYRAENEYKKSLIQTIPGGPPNQNFRRPDRH